ncbi:MAG: peptidoglycan-binding protein [Planctomycetota bacterium]
MKTRALVAAMAAGLLAMPALADPGVVQVRRNTKLIDSKGKELGVLRIGERYVAREDDGTRVRLDFAGRTVSLPWTQLEAAPEGAVGVGSRLATLRVHDAPDGRAVGTIQQGQRYVREGGQDSWVKIRFDGQRYGWVYAPLATGVAVPPAKAPPRAQEEAPAQQVERPSNAGLVGGVTAAVRLGEEGEHVERMQERLNQRLKALGLPQLQVTGKVDLATLQALRQTQSKRSATDRKGPKSSMGLGLAEQGGKPLAGMAPAKSGLQLRVGGDETPLEGAETAGSGSGAGAPRVRVEPPTLSPGERGPAVRMFQLILNHERTQAGELEVAVTGDFDPVTELALRDVQRRSSLAPSGKVDATTWKLLHTGLRSHPLGSIEPLSLPITPERYGRHTSAERDVRVHQLPGVVRDRPGPLLYESKFTIRSQQAGGLDPRLTPFVIVPRDFASKHPGFRALDLAAVIYRGRVAYAVCVPEGSTERIGEGSLAVARETGILADGDRLAGVLTIVFPGSGTGSLPATEEIARRGADLLRLAGGRP